MMLGQRILIIGSSGAGKSTLARQLGSMTGLPVIHLDRLSWLPGWKERPRPEFDALLAEAMAGERWIMDGNYSRTMAQRFARADTIIWLDFPRLLCLWRVVKRRVMHRRQTRPDMTPGCPEKLDLEFLYWIWNFPRHSRSSLMQKLHEHAAGNAIVHFRNPRQVRRWLAEMKRDHALIVEMGMSR